MSIILTSPALPLAVDSDGTVRVGGTRVTLETVVHAFRNGLTAEQIAEAYDAIRLADVYATIAYYLDHREAVDTYIAQRGREAGEFREKNPELFDQMGLKERLLTRRDVGPLSF
jgi:uncharacterized protein (DUF433 family)